MLLTIQENGAEPIFQQIVRQVKQLVATGRLGPGQPIPSIRELAISLRVNPNTVARAYRELEGDGVIETRRGVGAFVAEEPPVEALAAFRRMVLANRVRALVQTAKQLQIDKETVLVQVDRAFEEEQDA